MTGMSQNSTINKKFQRKKSFQVDELFSFLSVKVVRKFLGKILAIFLTKYEGVSKRQWAVLGCLGLGS